MTPTLHAVQLNGSIRRALAVAGGLALLAAIAPPGARADEGTRPGPAAAARVQVVSDAGGLRLAVDGKDFMVLGMNWDYFPIGTNYSYSLWTQPDEVIEAALAYEMPLLKRMGVNALRLYAGVPARWIRHIYEKYGIWSVLNHTVGRYGYSLDGVWTQNVDYSSPRFRAAVKAELAALVEEYRATPGLLMWLLGNENNYGLAWSSFEIENLPQGERDAAKARFLYSLLGEIIRDIKIRDANHPVAIANGDVQYIDLIAQECQGLDVFGANAYRGKSMGDLYAVVKAKLGLPVVFTEFGADAYDAKRGREDDLTQARYLKAQWREIYEQSAGKGGAGNAVGGFVFQWADGWWKYKQEVNLEVHDTNASWANGGYPEDYVEGENNMNEEWWGICAKGPPDARGLFELQPRTAYYVLQEAFRLPPYDPATTRAAIQAHFAAIDPDALSFHYKAEQARAAAAEVQRIRLTNLRLSFETYSTGGNRRWQRTDAPDGGRGFDHMESMYVDVQIQPTEKVTGTLSLNVLGNVAQNPIDQIYYERRGRPVTVVTGTSVTLDPVTGQPVVSSTTRTIGSPERVKIYKGSLAWDDSYFHLDGFFRAGHYHWGSEGDAFGLYREANYGANADVYDADVPLGFEVAGKRELEGLKLAFGPQLWWGANPMVMAKYRRHLGPFDATLLWEEDLAQTGATGLAAAVPEKAGRKAALALEAHLAGLGLEVAGLWAGSVKVGEPFIDASNHLDKIRSADTLGARAKLTWEGGALHWYAQGAYMGLVAEAGPDARVTFTGWSLKDSGSGNQVNALTGLAYNLGPFQLAPNFLWQRPLVGPGQSLFPSGGAAVARNIQVDPFVVRSNRETVAGELMLVFDPTPGTWLWAWDNDLREDALVAASLDVVLRHQPTTTDASIFFDKTGTIQYGFPAGSQAADSWEVNARVVSTPSPGLRLVGHAFGGNTQARGPDPRQPHRYGADVRVTWRQVALSAFAKFNDWGPYDYHKDFNQTFPVQLMGDLSYNLGPARWLWLQQTRLGLRASSRYLNGYSGDRYVLDPASPRAWGHEYEIRTYVVVTM
jgi:hypothetical protein